MPRLASGPPRICSRPAWVKLPMLMKGLKYAISSYPGTIVENSADSNDPSPITLPPISSSRAIELLILKAELMPPRALIRWIAEAPI